MVQDNSLRITEAWGETADGGYVYFYPPVPTASACDSEDHSASSEQSC